MRDKKWQRSIWGYGAGIAALVICAAAAWMFPEAYGRWQDQRQLGQVQLSEQKEIEFMDGNSLDLIGRWRMLAECQEPFTWDNSEVWERNILDDMKGYAQACVKEAVRWCQGGLLPMDGEELRLSSAECCFWEHRILLAGEKEIPIGIFSFFTDQTHEEYVTVILDLEIKRAYYISAFGKQVREYIAKQLGYESAAQMRQRLQAGEEPLLTDLEVSGMDFASVCGAKSSQIDEKPGTLEFQAKLQYETFSIGAFRCVVQSEFFRESIQGEAEESYGIAVMFGPKDQTGLIADSMLNTAPYFDENWNPHEILTGTDDFVLQMGE